MECNREEALRAKEIAETKFESHDFAGARKLILKAQQLYPGLENVPQMLAVCDVHCVAQTKVGGNETDWYGILQVEPTADDASIKKQYRKFALLLHPDKNKFCGAEAAFKLVGEANAVLSDQMKRTLHDIKRRATINGNATSKSSRFQSGVVSSSNGHFGMQQSNIQTQSGIHVRVQTQSGVNARVQTKPNIDPTFWTICPFCQVKYQYMRGVEDKHVLCQNCQRPFIAKDYFRGYRCNPSSLPNQQDFSKQGTNYRCPGSTPFDGFSRNNSNQNFSSNMASQGGVNGSGRATNIPENTYEAKAKEETTYKQQMHEKTRISKEAEEARKRMKEEEETRKKMKEEEKEQKRREKEAEKKAKAEAKAHEALRKIEKQRKAKTEKTAGKDKTRKRLRKLKEGSSSESEENADMTLEDNLSDEQTAARGEGGVQSRRRSNRSKRNVSYRVDGSDDEDFVDFPPSKKSRGAKDETVESGKARAANSENNEIQKDKLQTEAEKGENQNMGQKNGPRTGGKMKDDSQVLKDEKDNQKSNANSTKEKNMKQTKREAVQSDSAKVINHEENGGKELRVEEVKMNMNTSVSTSETPQASSSRKPETFEVPDADFHDFDQDRTENDISDGQIWATYDNIDGMPRFYAHINKVLSMEPLQCRIAWLEYCPVFEEQLDWEEENLPVACGMFKRGKVDVIEGVNTFSHIIKWEKLKSKGYMNIFPHKDDVWAVFKNWHIGWKKSEIGKIQYEMVEVLSDYSEETGVEVAFLVKVDGFKVIFKRQVEQGVERRMHVPLKELLRFSHQVPAYKMTGDEGDGVPNGSWELDTASMPSELFHVEASKSSA